MPFDHTKRAAATKQALEYEKLINEGGGGTTDGSDGPERERG